MTFILRSYASLPTLRSARRRTAAAGRITGSKGSTTRTSIRPSSATVTRARRSSANTGTTARLRTQWRTSRCGWFTTCCLSRLTSTSICTFSRLSGVPTTTSITRLSVCTRITSKTSDGNPLCFHIRPSSVRTGRAVRSSHATRRAAKDWSGVRSATGGRSSSSTRWCTKLSPARSKSASKASNVPSTTGPRTKDCQRARSLRIRVNRGTWWNYSSIITLTMSGSTHS